MRPTASCLLAAMHLLLVTSVAAQARPRRVDEFLTSAVHFSPAQLASLSHGDVVEKVVPTSVDRDVTVFGVTHVDGSSAAFVQRRRDLSQSLRTPTRTAAGVFSTPAAPSDVRDIVITPDDVGELQKCKPNDCNFKLSTGAMERLHATIDWAAPDAAARVADYVRARMIEYVTEYRGHGNSAMVVYVDNGSVNSGDALVAMLRDSSFAPRGTASLWRHLTDYPQDSLRGATDAFYWSVDNLPHVRPILRIMHETIYAPPELPGTTIIAAKQIYADHYFEAGLELLAAVDDTTSAPDAQPSGFTLIAVRRYRFDHLPGGGLLNLRGRVIGGLREALRADLVRLKKESEVH